MKKRISVIGCLIMAAAAVTIGFGGSLAYADPNGNNGNHYGQLQNGNNGNHYGQSLQTTQTSNSVPGPDTLMLLGGGLAGLVAWRWKAQRR